MFKKINAILFNRRAQQYLSLTPREHRFVSYKKAKTILLLFESDYTEKNQNIHAIINELQYSEYDLLIDLTSKQVIPLEYLALYARASFKTGMRKTNLPIYDFVLDIEKVQIETESTEPVEVTVEETYLYNQIIFYLKSIQTTD